MSTDAITPLRQRMIEDMNARKLGAHSQRSHVSSCKRFAAFLKRSPDTATPDDVRRFQLHLAETGMSICNRNRIMTGVKFLFRVTLRRLDLAAEIYHLREPQKIPQVMSPDETRRLLAVASNLKVRTLLRTPRTLTESRCPVLRRSDSGLVDSGGRRSGVDRRHGRCGRDSAAMGGGGREARRARTAAVCGGGGADRRVGRPRDGLEDHQARPFDNQSRRR